MRQKLAKFALASALATGVFGIIPGSAQAVEPGVSPAPIQVVERHAERCVGLEVVRCAWINWDPVNHRLRGYASAVWGGSKRWNVAVNNLRVEYAACPCDGNVVGESGDYDGYHFPRDDAFTGLVGCVYIHGEFRVKYHWTATDGSTVVGGDETSLFFRC